MRTDRTFFRTTALTIAAVLSAPLMAQEAADAAISGGEPLFNVTSTVIYALLAMCVLQVVFILSLAGIMKTLSGPGTWARWASKGAPLKVLVPFLMLWAHDAHAQAYVGDEGSMSNYHLFWGLVAINLFLFVVMLAQMNLMRGLVRAATKSEREDPGAAPQQGPSWVDRLMKRLTRQVEVEQEKDILMDHEYDGIRELDNVLPPWWLWLFYFTIAWGALYLINVHVVDLVPYQAEEYRLEMEQAKADVAAFMATQKNTVDETTVTQSTEMAVLNNGQAIFTQYCTPCHGADAAGSETSVGPNLTDAYWLHGGSINDVFKTIKYGVPEKGMISWKSQLKPVEISDVASYILSLQGTGGPTQKAPQGELWSDEPKTSGDSVLVVPDTAAMAVM